VSLITHVVVLAPVSSVDRVPGLADPLPFDEERHQALGVLDVRAAGGTKVYFGTVLAAAFNYLDVPAFEEWIAALPWGWVRPLVLIREEMEERIYRVEDGKLVPWTPRET